MKIPIFTLASGAGFVIDFKCLKRRFAQERRTVFLTRRSHEAGTRVGKCFSGGAAYAAEVPIVGDMTIDVNKIRLDMDTVKKTGKQQTV